MLGNVGPRNGSSPHTRGARGRRRQSRLGGRIIPAYAGSTPWIAASVGGNGDHPRIRGEHDMQFALLPVANGSSPHTRGALHVDF